MNLSMPIASLVVSGLLLGGCTQPGLLTATNQADTAPPAQVKPAEPATRPFAAETFYALLVAEFAGNRERYDIALGNYMQQARRTRDPGIAARATHIAHFLNVRAATLASAGLWLDIEPDNSEARFLLANELAMDGQLPEALEHSRILLQQGSTPVFQTIAAQAGRLPAAGHQALLQNFLDLLADHPQEQQLLIGTGLLLQQQRDYETALDYTHKALKLDPQSVPAAILEAKLLQQLERPQEALASLSRQLAQQPENQRLRLQYARLLASYDINEAYDQFAMLAEENPFDPDMIFSLALISFELGRMDEARNEFEKLTDGSPHQSSAHFYLGRIARQNADLALALLHFQDVSPGPDFLPAKLQIADLLIGQGQPEIAAEHLRKTRLQYPELAQRLTLLEAEVLRQYAHTEAMEQTLNNGLRDFPASTDLLYARAMLFVERGLIDKAEVDLRAIIASEPDNATALNALGYTLADNTQRYEEALALIHRALQLRPDDPAILDSLGWVSYRLGNLEESILRLRQAMKLAPDHEIAAHLGEALWANGNRDEARSAWQEGLKLRPDSPLIRATLRRLLGQEQLP